MPVPTCKFATCVRGSDILALGGETDKDGPTLSLKHCHSSMSSCPLVVTEYLATEEQNLFDSLRLIELSATPNVVAYLMSAAIISSPVI
jgi:hypothetical protein